MSTARTSMASSRADELLSALYQQVTEQQAARFGSGYDIEAGLDWYRNWLRDQAAGDAQDARDDRDARDVQAAWDVQDADHVITALYAMHYRPLVRLAALLVHDVATAEEIVQDSLIALHAGLHRLRDPDKALAYLRAAVVNRSRSVLRHRTVVDKNPPNPVPDALATDPEQLTLTLLARSTVVSALRNLPVRQREVVVLRFYADLSEAQIAATMGITRGAVKSHTARAISSLRTELEKPEG
jgi:RNA polymerase sigma-70 factor (sigma-E family)